MTHIAICIPSMGTFDDYMACSAMALCIESVGSARVFSIICRGFPSLGMNRNAITQQALDGNSDYLFWIDTDMIFPPNSLRRLMKHDKPIAGCTYATKIPPHVILGRPKDPEKTTGLCEFDFLPGGLMLIDAKVYREAKTAPVWYHESYNPDIQEEVNFCLDRGKEGHQIWCDMDLSLEVKHLGKHPVGIA